MTKFKALGWLFLISVLDALIPLPILGFVLVYVIFRRPAWFWDMVKEIYSPPNSAVREG